MKCSVIINGNNHQYGRFVTIIDQTISVKKCKEIIDNIHKLFPEFIIDRFEIDLQETSLGKTDEEWEEMFIRNSKKAYYNVKSNCLQIWQQGYPIYENNNGIICKDTEALADCLM